MSNKYYERTRAVGIIAIIAGIVALTVLLTSCASIRKSSKQTEEKLSVANVTNWLFDSTGLKDSSTLHRSFNGMDNEYTFIFDTASGGVSVYPQINDPGIGVMPPDSDRLMKMSGQNMPKDDGQGRFFIMTSDGSIRTNQKLKSVTIKSNIRENKLDSAFMGETGRLVKSDNEATKATAVINSKEKQKKVNRITLWWLLLLLLYFPIRYRKQIVAFLLPYWPFK